MVFDDGDAPAVLAQCPQLTPDGLAAAFRYAADALKGEHTWELLDIAEEARPPLASWTHGKANATSESVATAATNCLPLLPR
jgi:hypothetical protein